MTPVLEAIEQFRDEGDYTFLILLVGDLVDPVDLRLRLDLITTTSPSALLYGSIDGFRRHMVAGGERLLDAALARAGWIRERLSRVSGLSVMDASIIGTDRD